MELIKSTTFTNSYTYEHLLTISLYKSDIGYNIINEFAVKLTGVARTTRMEAEEYYFEVIKEARQALNSMEQPFHTTNK